MFPPELLQDGSEWKQRDMKSLWGEDLSVWWEQAEQMSRVKQQTLISLEMRENSASMCSHIMASVILPPSATHIISLSDHLFPTNRWPWKSKTKEETDTKKNQGGFLASRIKNCTYNNPLQSWRYNLWSDLAWHCSARCHGATVAETTWGLAFCSQHLLVWHRLTGRTKRAFRQTFNTFLHSHWHGGPGEFMRSFRKVRRSEVPGVHRPV